MFKWLSLVALCCASMLPVSAQVASAEVSGTVTDPSGAGVANAKVIATNKATNVARETVTNPTGAYLINLLPPGDYTLTVEASGFRKLSQTGLTLQINQQAQLDLALQVGQVNETVEVTAAAPMLQSEASSLGTVVSEKLVNQLPLNGRNFIQLATLSPGVNGVGFGAGGSLVPTTSTVTRRFGAKHSTSCLRLILLSQNLVTGIGCLSALPSQKTSFWSMPLPVR